MCLQELKLTSKQLPGAKMQAKGRTWNTVASPAKVTQVYPRLATTGGCMVAASGGAGVTTHRNAVDEAVAHRLAACHVGACWRGGLHVLSGWLHHTEGLTSRNLSLLDSWAGLVASLRGPWVISADWNSTPQEISETT